MALWMVRAGNAGQHEIKFLDDSRIYVTWNGLSRDLSDCGSRDRLRDLLAGVYPQFGDKKIINHAAQLWSFVGRMTRGDWVVMPSKLNPTVHVGEVTGDYEFLPEGPNPYFHARAVRWVEQDVPREAFGQDLLYSFGAFMSICRVKRNDAEERLKKMSRQGWVDPMLTGPSIDLSPAVAAETNESSDDPSDLDTETDLAEVARDAIAKLILARTKGHGLSDLVAAILRAQGYTTEVSPPGPDGGVDILAGTGPLGFGQPKLCVQVKSTHGPVDAPTLHQLIGSMQNMGATQGLLVSWGGFKKSVEREKMAQFFRVRLWDRSDVMAALFDHYDQLDPDMRALLPLKRVWVPVAEGDEGS